MYKPIDLLDILKVRKHTLKTMKLRNTLTFKIALMALAISISTPAIAIDFDAGVFEFQQKMANKGDAQAQYRLGVLFETGKGTKTSYDEALTWYKKSAKQNYNPAKIRITYLDIKKTGYKKAKHGSWLKELKTEAQTSGELMMLLASMHEKGFIVKKDLKKTKDLLKKATFKNAPGAESELERIEALLDRQNARATEQKKKQQADQERKQKADQARKAKEKQAQAAKAKQDAIAQQQSQTEQQKKKLEAEKRRIAKEKRKLEQQRRALAKQQAKQSKAANKKQNKKESHGFDTDPCKGPKARFMTMCK